jgi:hypothetical protein
LKEREKQGSDFQQLPFGKKVAKSIAAAFWRQRINMRRLSLTMGSSYHYGGKEPILRFSQASKYVQHMYCGSLCYTPIGMKSLLLVKKPRVLLLAEPGA